jgi:hypothetical protein
MSSAIVFETVSLIRYSRRHYLMVRLSLKFKFCMKRTQTELTPFACIGRSNATGSSWSSVTDNTSKSYEIQALAEDSFITRSTEITTTPQDCTNILVTPMNEVSISAEVLFSDEYTIEMGSDTSVSPYQSSLITSTKY